MKTKQQWQLVLKYLSQNDNVSTACKRAGVDTATYYRKLAKSRRFKHAAEEAISSGAHLFDDFVDNQVKSKVHEGYWPATKYYADRCHPKYMKKTTNLATLEAEPKKEVDQHKSVVTLKDEYQRLLLNKVSPGEIRANWQALAIRVHNRRRSRGLEPEGLADAMLAELLLSKACEEKGDDGTEIYERYPIEATDGYDLYHFVIRANVLMSKEPTYTPETKS